MKKHLIFLALIGLIIAQNAWAQNGDKPFKKIYRQVVPKLSGEKGNTIEFANIDSLGLVRVSYEKEHFCLCHDPKCRGPRLTVTMKNAYICIFPAGDYFIEINSGCPDLFIAEIDINKEKAQEDYFAARTKQILLDYSK